MFSRSLVTGTVAGFILGFFLKFVENLTDRGVYTLLLNVDFLPFFGAIIWPEWVEFVFHLIVSIGIAYLYLFSLSKFSLARNHPFTAAIFLTLPAVFLYFPLAYLALKPVPELTDWVAFIYWVLGHFIYTYVLYILTTYIRTK